MSPIIKIFQPSGILDGIRGSELRQQITFAVENSVDIVLIDLAAVKIMDSSGLGTLLSALRIVKSAEAKLVICSVNDSVKMLFEITKMERIFQIFVDQDEFHRALVQQG
ncbi:STAS domain-containing protein [Nostoc sphaeroides]|uniref:Anti-sigma factor antagonist n=1 Tax=Nostoc sphaeroides CCNUC1 TaxID=2653204 RepID=A0A5P8WD90_9NOSO|nr:STAS domain-containing protein [Nostoc sphaeroides]MCC5633104.1 STAS domain-containing protein [Nostoc sphaeroides CHAB 2801]QFS50522.1 anti-sigma factor antagonist [Nostoc sphaeroides CCNUC1]